MKGVTPPGARKQEAQAMLGRLLEPLLTALGGKLLGRQGGHTMTVREGT
jgi:hypothetical protein